MTRISERINEWRGHLLDLTKRNKLVSCKYGSRGALELLYPETKLLWKRLVMSGKALEFPWRRDLVPPPNDEDAAEYTPSVEDALESANLNAAHLLAAMDDKPLDRRLRRLQLNAKTSLSEQGVNNLFVAFGLLKWFETPDSKDEILSPLLLVPVELRQESAHKPWTLQLYEEEVVPNFSLQQYLSQRLRYELPEFDEANLLDDANGLQEYFDLVQAAVQDRHGWEVTSTALLGTFSFQKLAMWMDLDTNSSSICEHNLCCSIAGDVSGPVNPQVRLPDPAEFDSLLDPTNIHSILDCDSSQLEAIVAAREGMSFVLDGPPGTGKSQTIANIIAEFLANGKTVLFVSEKSAALEVVKRRLDDNGLGDFCLECHSHKANKKDVIHEMGRCLELPAERYRDQGSQLNELRSSRAKLNGYAESLHRIVEPLNLSPYQVHGLVAEMEVVPRAKANIPEIMNRDAVWLQEVIELLKRLTVCESYIDAPDSHPWRKCTITTFSLTTLDDTRDLLEEAGAATDALIVSLAELDALGFEVGKPKVRDIPSVGRAVRSLLDYPLIPAEWLSVENPMTTANDIVSMCNAQHKVVIMSRDLAEFREDASASDDLIARLSGNGQSMRELLLDKSDLSVRTQAARLSRASKTLESSTNCLRDLQETIANVAAHLSVTLDKETKLQFMPKLQALATDVSLTTTMRPGWFKSETQRMLLQFVEEYESLFEGDTNDHLAFADDAHDIVTVVVANAICSDAYLTKIAESLDGDSVRNLHDRLQVICGLLSRLQPLIKTMREDVGELLLSFLGNSNQATLSCSQLKLGTIASLSESAMSLSTHQGFQPSWLLQETRDRLLPVAQAASAELQHIEGLRIELSKAFAPSAFEEAGAQFATSGKSVASPWKWFGGTWRDFRENAEDYFVDDLPWWPPTILEPLRSLRAFHRRLSRVVDYENKISSLVSVPQRRQAAWEEFAKSLESCERVSSILGLGSTAFGTEKTVDLEAIRIHARKLQGSQEELQQFLLDARQKEMLRSIDCDLSRLGAYTMDELEDYLSILTKRYQDRLIELTKVTDKLDTNRDVAIPELKDQALILQKRHRNFLRSQEFAEEYNDDISLDGGPIDWSLLVDSIRTVQQMQQRIPVLPPLLIKAMCIPEGIDRSVLGDLAESLGRQIEQLQTAMRTVDGDVRLGYQSRKYGYLGESSESLLALLSDVKGKIDDRLDTLGEVIGFLKDGVDIPLDKAGSLLKKLITLREARHEVKASLTTLPGFARGVSSVDWVATDDNARWLQQFYEQHDGEVPEHLVRLLTDSTVRLAIETKVDTIEQRLDEFNQAVVARLSEMFDLDDDVSVGITLRECSLQTLASWLIDRVNDVERLEEWTTFQSIQSAMSERGADNFLDQVFRKEISAAAAPDAFQLRFYRIWLDQVYRTNSTLGEFSIDDHQSLIKRFRQLDRKSITGSHKRIRAALLNDPSRPRSAMGASTSETGILTREANKKRRHLSLRQLFNSIPTVLQRLKPCMMMSPLAVSTYLESQDIRFDAVIFDEASQVLPHDAIGAIYRGHQLIVAGDQQQLPPTTFFSRMAAADDFIDDDDEEDSGIGKIDDYESILDVCTSLLPRKRLCWHYRSRREPLIAFSNHHYYDDDLVTFPSIHDGIGKPAVEHVYVSDGTWVGGRGGGFNQEEAQKLVELICDHYETTPEGSLGVITLNQKQQLLVIDLLAEIRGKSHKIDRLLGQAEKHSEPLFVKNLENVQGDERDHIIISMGYARDTEGTFSQNFGPINRKGGERRLNVAVTRARLGVKFVSSVRHFDIKQSGSKGVQTLRSYLEYAESGALSPNRARFSPHEEELDATFEREILGTLERAGFHVTPRIGCGKFRIDFGIKHPEEDRFLLGIECDGMMYQSTPVARDRERLRPQVLEQLGWQICRVWSTDWVRNPNRQIERIHVAFQAASNGPPQQESAEESPTELEDEHEDERPILLSNKKSIPRSPKGSIDTIPQLEGIEYLVKLLRQMGATEEDDLIRFVAKEMGFGRTGKVIRRHIHSWIIKGCKLDKLRRDDDGRVQVATSVTSGERASATEEIDDANLHGSNQHRTTDGCDTIASAKREAFNELNRLDSGLEDEPSRHASSRVVQTRFDDLASRLGDLPTCPVYMRQKRRAGQTAPADDLVIRLLATLEANNWKMSLPSLSREVRLPVYRLLTTLPIVQQVLNVEGRQVIQYDETLDCVEVNEELLRSEFSL